MTCRHVKKLLSCDYYYYIIVHLCMQPEGYGAAIYIFWARPVSHLRLPGFFSCGVARSSSFVAQFLSPQHPPVGVSWCPVVQNAGLNIGKIKRQPERQIKTLAKKRQRKDNLCAGSSYLPTRSPSGFSLSLPHPSSSSNPSPPVYGVQGMGTPNQKVVEGHREGSGVETS